jgi:hypothetical protein
MGRLGRFLLIAAIAVVALLVLVVAFAPILLKGPIIDRVTSELNERIDADVSIGDVNVSLLKSFPSLSVDVDRLKVVGREPFAGIRARERSRGCTPRSTSRVRWAAGPTRSRRWRSSSRPSAWSSTRRGRPTTTSGQRPPHRHDGRELELLLEGRRFPDRGSASSRTTTRRPTGTSPSRNLDHKSKGDFSDAVVHLETHTEIAKLTVTDGAVPLLKDTRWVADVASTTSRRPARSRSATTRSR